MTKNGKSNWTPSNVCRTWWAQKKKIVYLLQTRNGIIKRIVMTSHIDFYMNTASVDSPIHRQRIRRTTWWSLDRLQKPPRFPWSIWWPTPDPISPCSQAHRRCLPAVLAVGTTNRKRRVCTAWKRPSRRTWPPIDRRRRSPTSKCRTCNLRRKSTPIPVSKRVHGNILFNTRVLTSNNVLYIWLGKKRFGPFSFGSRKWWSWARAG